MRSSGHVAVVTSFAASACCVLIRICILLINRREAAIAKKLEQVDQRIADYRAAQVRAAEGGGVGQAPAATKGTLQLLRSSHAARGAS